MPEKGQMDCGNNWFIQFLTNLANNSKTKMQSAAQGKNVIGKQGEGEEQLPY
jgi:hypothetical protein